LNWFTIAILIFWLLIVLISWHRGFVKTVFSMFFLLLVIFGTVFLTPYAKKMLTGSESITAYVEQQSENYITKKADEMESGSGTSYAWLGFLPLPDTMKEALSSGNNTILGELLKSDTVKTYLAEKMTAGILNAAAVIVSILISIIVFAILEFLLNRLANLPVLGAVNKFLGFLLGFAKGLIFIWILFIIIGLIKATPVGQTLTDQISGSPLLSWVNTNNLLYKYGSSLLHL